MEILPVFVTLFLIMDPFGNIPVFLPILEGLPPERRRRILVRELLIALLIIVVFVFCGSYVMRFLGLRQESVSIAGGIILFLIALRMVFPTPRRDGGQDLEGEPFIVPLAVPLIAGPSLLAALLLFSTGAPDRLLHLLLAAVLAWSASFVVLLSAMFLSRILSRKGLMAIERLMGMILIALSVQLFLDGLGSYLGS